MYLYKNYIINIILRGDFFMKKIIFEIGERVNGTRWTVIGGPISKNKATYYTCRCDCGCVREVSAKSLKYGKSKSCGCQHIENARAKFKNVVKQENDINLAGKTINYIKVIKKLDGYGVRSKWECKCLNCGKTFTCIQHVLLSENVKSCGCYNRENASKNVGNYTGRIDGSCISAIKSAKISKANTSGVRGVSFKKNIGKYEAYIGFKGKLKILGFFDTLEEAAQARKKAEDEIYKPFIEEHTKKPDGN